MNAEKKEGTWDPKGFLENEEVLLVGGGRSVKQYKSQIIEYIERKEMKVIFLNINSYVKSTIRISNI